MDYRSFIQAKTQEGADHGIDPVGISDYLRPFQRDIVEWAIRKGRAAIFADCGLGKTIMELQWADCYRRHTGKPTLILTPLAVGPQIKKEGDRFGFDVSMFGSSRSPIIVCNYEKIHQLSPDDYGAVVCDESSILKNYDGKRSSQIIIFMRKMRYRLLATATAAPNDYTELGTSSECLGVMGHMDMLGKFFRNDQGNIATKRMYGESPKWRFKGHSQEHFWRWVCSWAKSCRMPSDIGHSDDGYVLPELIENKILVESGSGVPATTLAEQRLETRTTIGDRCERMKCAVSGSDYAVIWCHLNEEGDMLERIIPGAQQVKGSQTDAKKESILTEFSAGNIPVLITKPKIGAWGLNWQHCNTVGYFPSHSYEQYYQAVRRCWRFGQTRPVTTHMVYTEGQNRILENLAHKFSSASVMFDNLIREMNNPTTAHINRSGSSERIMPKWI